MQLSFRRAGRRDVPDLGSSVESRNFHTEALSLLKVWVIASFSLHSAEIDQKLQEIMKQTGYLKIDGQVRYIKTH